MNWRPWVVGLALMAGGIVNVALLITEEIDPVRVPKKLDLKTDDPLGMLALTSNARFENFKKYGLPTDMAKTASERSGSILKSRREVLKKLLEDQKEGAQKVFCKDAELPPRYSALSVLILEEAGKRRVLDPKEIAGWSVQPWYLSSPVADVYDAVEFAEPRKDDATAMGIAAILTGVETKAVNGEGRWGDGVFGWSFDNVLSDYEQVNIRNTLIDYFALMHAIAELANEEKGICN